MSDNRPNLGKRLRSLRKQKDLTLTRVSKLSGISRSTLYKVENSGVSLTYDKLVDLAMGLGVGIEQLFQDSDDNAVTARLAVDHIDTGELMETDIYRTRYLCSQLKGKMIIPTSSYVRAHSLEDFGPLFGHPGEEMDIVVAGSVEVHTAYYKPVRVDVGGVIYFDATMPHAIISIGDDDAKIITIVTSHEFSLHEAQSTTGPLLEMAGHGHPG